jgi:hypothetical protein
MKSDARDGDSARWEEGASGSFSGSSTLATVVRGADIPRHNAPVRVRRGNWLR